MRTSDAASDDRMTAHGIRLLVTRRSHDAPVQGAALLPLAMGRRSPRAPAPELEDASTVRARVPAGHDPGIGLSAAVQAAEGLTRQGGTATPGCLGVVQRENAIRCEERRIWHRVRPPFLPGAGIAPHSSRLGLTSLRSGAA